MDPEATKAVECLLKSQWEKARRHIKRLTTEKKRSLTLDLTFEQKRALLISTLEHLPTNQDYGLTVASLFDQSLARYIYTHIDVAIPYALQLPVITSKTTGSLSRVTSSHPVTLLMEAVASTLFLETHSLYDDYGYLALVHCLLIPSNLATSDVRQDLLEHIFTTVLDEYPDESKDSIPTRLLQGHVTRATSLLAVELWQPDHQHVLNGLNQVKIWSGYEATSLEYYLRTFMLSIVNHINHLLSSFSPICTESLHLLSSLTILLDIIGPEAYNFIPQLLLTTKTLTSKHTAIHQDQYGDVYCLLWNRLISLSTTSPKNTEQQNARYLNEVVRGMVHAFPLCDQDIKAKLADGLTHAIKSHILKQPTTSFTLINLTHLPPYSEFDNLRQWIAEKERSPQQQQQQAEEEEDIHVRLSSAADHDDHDIKQQKLLKEMIIHMSMDEVIPSFDSLQKLHRLLSKEQCIFFTMGNTNEAWPLLGELYDLLLRIIQQNAYRHDICGLAASCLGLIGAIDPSRLLSTEERQDIMLKFKRQQQQENNEGDDGATIEKTTPAMNSTRYSHDMIILDNYTNMSENQAFAIHLIVHYFLPTFYTTSTSTTSSSSILAPGFSGTYNGDHSIQSCSQYAIQEILKAVAITSNRILGREEKGEGGGGGRDRRKSRSIMGRSAGNNNNSNYKDVNAAFNLETRKLWFSLDPMIKDVIQPLLHSKFEADIQVIPRAPPLYALAGDSFEAWIQSFYYFLLEKVNTNTEVLPIFNACVPSVKVGHTLLTQHLIPFLILRVLLSSSSSSSSSFATPSTSTFDTPSIQHDHQLILDEIIGVLENDSFGVDMKQRTLQMVVSITGHCQSWIRQKLQLKKKQLKHTSSLCKEDAEIYAVKTFLTKIPNGLMTKAAFQTGNYPQAMMHFELYLKEVQKQKRPLQQQPLSNEYLDVICQTYMKLEGPETMPEILSKFDSHMTPQLEILQFESSGDWHLAKLVYERLLPTTTATQKEGSGDNSNQQLLCRYFNCLRRLNDYDRIINYSNEMLKDQSRGLPYALLEQVNTYRAEAAWKSGNWYLLHECLKLPMDDSFEASIACALAHMQCNNPLAVHLTLEQGRLNEVKRICQKSSGGVAAASYQKSYDAVLRLQLLQEIDSIMTLMEPHQQGVFQHVIKQEQGQTSAAITNVDNDPFLLWKLKFLKVKPSYASQRQLLDLRLVAEFELWKTNNNHNEATMSETEKKLRLLLAKTARKAKDLTTAFGAIYQEPLLSEPLALIQLAKWNLERKDPKTCSRYLNDRRIANLPKAKYMAARYKESQCNNMIRKTTHPARYQDEVEKIAAHYSDVRKTMPNWEKIFYVSGSFTEQTYGMAENDPKYFIRAAEAIQHYCEALKIGSRYYYSTMPRLLSLWLRISEQMKSALTVGSKFSDDMNVAITQAYSSANQTLSDYVDQIPPYLFGLALPRLVSRLAIKDEEAVKILSKMIVKVLISYPRSTIWSLQYALHSDDHNVSSITANILREAEALQPNSLVTKIIHQTEQFTKYLEIMAKYKKLGRSPNIPVLGGKTLFESNFPELLAMKHLDICIPQETAMLPSLPESLSSAPTTTSNIYGSRHHQPYPVDLPTIVRVLPTVQVMSSLQQPKRLSFLASDGKIYNFLCKCNDELRKDARMMEFSHMINKFLIKNATSRQQQLYIRTYAVIPLGVRWGLIEWINNLNTLKSIVCDKWEAADPIDGPDRLNRLRMMMKTRNESSRCTVDDKVDLLVNHVYPQSPVVFASWFLDTFPEPSDWFASRSRYVRTLAVMSIVGYVLGLGDRHAENIMFDATNGDTVHVDVNMLFDHGHDLTVPEIVPFRLTRNLIDAMGVTKETGLFRRACMITLEVLREHRLQLLSVFETFLFDPIDERRRRDANLSHQQTARKAINVIDNKIQTKHLVKTTVDMLIKEASSNLNLAQMFFGWSPFL